MRALLLTLVLTAALAIGAAAGLRILNTRVIPNALDRSAARLSQQCGCDIQFDGGRFVPFNGLQLGEVRITMAYGGEGGQSDGRQKGGGEGRGARTAEERREQTATALQEARVESTRIRASLATALSLWNLSRRTSDSPIHAELDARTAQLRSALGLGQGNPTEALWGLLAEAAEHALLPRSTILTGVDARIALPGERQSRTVTLDRVRLDHNAGHETVKLNVSRSAVPTITAGFEFDYAQRDASARLSLSGVDLTDIPKASNVVTSGLLEGNLDARSNTSGSYEIRGRIGADGVRVDLTSLAAEAVGPINLGYTFHAVVAPTAAQNSAATAPPARAAPMGPRGVVDLKTSELTLNGVTAELSGTFTGFGPEMRSGHAGSEPARHSGKATVPRALEAAITLPRTPVQELVHAVPEELLGPLAETEVSGELAWDASFRLSQADVGEAQWSAETSLTDFEVQKIHASRNPYKLNGAFFHTITDESIDFSRRIMIPPALGDAAPDPDRSDGTPEVVGTLQHASREVRPPSRPDPEYTYVRLEDMSRWVAGAVLSAEDGDFYYHNGINFTTLAQAIERNLRAGEIRYGASTISMQVAKMLFLEHDRVFSRKLQEALLVYLMEQEVPVSKERILELYLNIAEFGPGVFGIYDAAEYYFAKAPAELDPGEATWLAGILPSPKRYHRHYERGSISEGWFERMKSYLDIMLERDRIREEEYRAAVSEPPAFAK